ncbi:hypothetical protein QWY75_11870 [Pontixanthobacter aestiaquae]|uniref:Uncharacterized protein n=1 Tax=Pontixanthobacter aestiaquae TaxID=1509367 RepID=A0A844Z330_9SPHN|nr:hypothetical protein [Pontixanthobacter aestiaquae]MDN3646900.1 hypothetical protein [Pontixanthobacter aestiaquae]MXO82118.1 hypothetical protein [Pontixanthobacter aestiaquae]
MLASATVSEGCRVSATPFIKTAANKLRGRTKVKMQCGKPTVFAISLRGAIVGAKSKITRTGQRAQNGQQSIRVDPKVAFGKRVYRATAGKVAKFVASSRMKKLTPQHMRGGNRELIVAIDF